MSDPTHGRPPEDPPDDSPFPESTLGSGDEPPSPPPYEPPAAAQVPPPAPAPDAPAADPAPQQDPSGLWAGSTPAHGDPAVPAPAPGPDPSAAPPTAPAYPPAATHGDPLAGSGLSAGDPLAGSSPAPAPAPGYGAGSPPPPGAGGTATFGGAHAPATGQFMLAGWWRRVGAQLVDGLIIIVGALIILSVFGAVFSVGFFASGNEDSGVAALIVSLIVSAIAIAIVALIYAPALMARTNGRTIGRMVTGIRVVRADGQPITFGFAALREVAVKALGFGILNSFTFGLASLIDVLWPLWDDENRALHDFVVNTRTVLD